MSIKRLLLWEKWRPKTIEDTILPDRIKKQFENGITRNYIFYGSYGTGKTTLARILVGKYSKDKAYIELNSSLFTSIDVLRSEIDQFCRTAPILETEDEIKYVFLDEVDRISPQYQDALKAFIEKYHEKVRFILTTNHINKISQGIKSRFTEINFDCQSIEEEKYLKTEIYKKINNVILPSVGKEISKENLISVITKKFPDFRSIMGEIQNYIETGDLNQGTGNVSTKLKLELYNLLYDSSMDYEKIYHFIMGKFGPEKIDVMMSLLGRGFIDWALVEKRESIDKLFECNFVISDYTSKLETNTDPIVLGMTVIGKFRDILA